MHGVVVYLMISPYYAWCILFFNVQCVKLGKLVDYLKKNEKKNKSFVVNKKIKGSKKSILTYELIKKLNNYYVVKINIETWTLNKIFLCIFEFK